jgi:hypothetical protein
MVETDFMKLYERLNTVTDGLTEGWHRLDYGKLWYSDSEVQFRNFMKNLPNSGLKGVRLIVAPDCYLVADASELSHDEMIEAAENELYIDVSYHTEWSTCGVPKCTDYDLGNYEIADLIQSAKENPDDDFYDEYRNYDPAKTYQGELIADYGIFELHLYNFISRTVPEYTPKYSRASIEYFEGSETHRVLKPLLKRIYIYGQE